MKGRSAVWQFALFGLIGVLVIGLIATFAFRAIARQQALDEAKDLTRLTASAIIEPALTTDLEDGDKSSLAEFDDRIRQSVLAHSDIVRIKIWTPDGRIVYSDEPRVVGDHFPLDEDELTALNSGRVVAEVSDLDSPENRFERGRGELLEVYQPVRLPDGHRLLFEAYLPTATISDTTRDLTRAFIPALIGGLLLLQLLNLPLARRLVNRERSAQRDRESYMQAAMDASERERRRIAADLHDGVVQDMNGLSLSIAAEAQAAEAKNDPEQARRLREISASGRQVTRGLRNVLVDIYPPTLHRQGLAAALADLTENVSRRGIRAEAEVERSLDLSTGTEALLFRIAQESSRNVISHADAQSMQIEITREGENVVMTIADDGRGLEPASDETPPEGHLGLRAMESLTRDAGGEFTVESGPGRGTTVRVEVPNR
ncbi:MAG TPA: ATP-binding protein [Solirubrobacterales bacterium]|nr:ATP-binding protein [Solirubrobacterales bacterium]